jgi:hypothetical protein
MWQYRGGKARRMLTEQIFLETISRSHASGNA